MKYKLEQSPRTRYRKGDRVLFTTWKNDKDFRETYVSFHANSKKIKSVFPISNLTLLKIDITDLTSPSKEINQMSQNDLFLNWKITSTDHDTVSLYHDDCKNHNYNKDDTFEFELGPFPDVKSLLTAIKEESPLCPFCKITFEEDTLSKLLFNYEVSRVNI